MGIYLDHICGSYSGSNGCLPLQTLQELGSSPELSQFLSSFNAAQSLVWAGLALAIITFAFLILTLWHPKQFPIIRSFAALTGALGTMILVGSSIYLSGSLEELAQLFVDSYFDVGFYLAPIAGIFLLAATMTAFVKLGRPTTIANVSFASLRSPEIALEPIAKQTRRKTMFCRKCGVKISRDSKFCEECGANTV
jgi:hypothetical protein